MKVKFTSNISYQTYPITDDMIDINEETLKEIGKTKQYLNGEIVDYASNTARINELKNLLVQTDYQAIKYAEGQISEEEYSPIKVQRQSWRDEINELEGVNDNSN